MVLLNTFPPVVCPVVWLAYVELIWGFPGLYFYALVTKHGSPSCSGHQSFVTCLPD